MPAHVPTPATSITVTPTARKVHFRLRVIVGTPASHLCWSSAFRRFVTNLAQEASHQPDAQARVNVNPRLRVGLVSRSGTKAFAPSAFRRNSNKGILVSCARGGRLLRLARAGQGQPDGVTGIAHA